MQCFATLKYRCGETRVERRRILLRVGEEYSQDCMTAAGCPHAKSRGFLTPDRRYCWGRVLDAWEARPMKKARRQVHTEEA